MCLARLVDIAVVHFVHSGTSAHRRQTWPLAAPVCRRPTSLRSTVDDAALAADRLAVCLADMGAWLKSSCLRLNPTKTQVMWLGSQQMLARLDIDDIGRGD